MDLVSHLACAVLLVAAGAAPAHGCGLAQWEGHIAEAAGRYAVPAPWIRAVLRAESAGCTHLDGRPITSHAGAMGLMQIMPATWTELRAQHGLGTDPHDPRENILAGAAYLRGMADRFGVPGAFAAYHAGPGRYETHVLHAAPLPAETRRYVARVTADVGLPPPGIDPSSPPDLLFAVVRRRHDDSNDRDGRRSTDPRLFVPLQPSGRTIQVPALHATETTHAYP